MRHFILAMLLPLAAGPARAAQDSEHLHIEEVSESFLRQWAAAEESNNSQELLKLYAVAHDTLARKLAQPDPDTARWIPLPRMLAAKLAALPPAALEAHEVIARQVLETILEPTERRKAISKYAYTAAGRAALDLMANVDGDRGRMTEAMRGWAGALEVRPGVETVARLALAHSLRKDGASLVTLRAQAEARGIKGEITVGGVKRELYEYLDSLAPAAAAPLLKPMRLPTCEIPLGHYDLKPVEDGRYGELLAVALPAIGRSGQKDLVVVNNGLRVIAIEPARAEGGLIDESVEWRWPRERPVRSWIMGNYNNALPYVGATIADGRVFCPMFAERQEARQQVGRRQQKFLGASVLRAINLATGEAIWDTETVEVEGTLRTAQDSFQNFRPSPGSGAAGSKVADSASPPPPAAGKLPLLEFLNFDKSDFCFGGPPLVRGDRVYAPVMTSPYTGRQCWVLCLGAATGQPLWCADLGTAPQSKQMSVTQIAEEDGTLIVSTNYGVVAALDSSTGRVEWLVKYHTQDRPQRPTHRTAGSPPVIAGSLVYVLAQDCDGLLAFDRWTGLEAPLVKQSQEVAWDGIAHLLGRAGDWLVFSGARNVAIRPIDGQVVLLQDADSPPFGRGAIVGDRLYLPTRNELSIVDTTTWKVAETLQWGEKMTPGNLLISGPLLIHLSNRLDLYTSADLLKDRFGPKVDAAVPAPVECRQFAKILEASGRLKESVPYYRRALKAWETDPSWQETSELLRKKLIDLADKLGADYPRE